MGKILPSLVADDCFLPFLTEVFAFSGPLLAAVVVTGTMNVLANRSVSDKTVVFIVVYSFLIAFGYKITKKIGTKKEFGLKCGYFVVTKL